MMKRLRYGVILMMLMATAVFGLTACDEKPETTEAVVTDGITDADVDANRPEVLPYVTAYRVLDKSNDFFAKHLLSENIEGLGVVFFVRRFGDSAWIRLGKDVLYTDENGRAALPGLRSRLPQSLLDQAPIDLELQARLYFNESTYVSDDQGLVRILSADKTKNPGVVYTDHDNTLHATGGQNAVQDWIDFLNFAKNDWPQVDGIMTDNPERLEALLVP